MNVTPIYVQNNVQLNNTLNFKKYEGIANEFYPKCTSKEIEVLLNEAQNFVETKICDIKYVMGPNSLAYCVGINLHRGPMIKKDGKSWRMSEINPDTIGWRIINSVTCPNYYPHYLSFSDYASENYDHYIINDLDDETWQVYNDNCLRLEKEFSKYHYLQYASGLQHGLAYAYAYKAYWERQDSEVEEKEKQRARSAAMVAQSNN